MFGNHADASVSMCVRQPDEDGFVTVVYNKKKKLQVRPTCRSMSSWHSCEEID